ncbi:MarR family winged helix-turn-helix transcriptional regulator [Sessilibacter corallicola]|uniref:MarR family winged helix-turn-helix transcriptional regulator n=1 Tax=Sessilibacter corallicola TaxID=2904075 RepID=UPI001E35ABFD|nr:MarR family winged helix-turn-helix transcriptional regulator [Sessilibacter corallicola]MCE2029690.1 MarR family winged helix-turn-helix transcriptional regulator [Sessilibacter corallicola]
MEKRLFTLINAAQHRMFKFADLECENRLGLTVTQSAALMFIAKNEGCQQKALANATGLNQSAVTGLINRMKKNGLIERKACAEDGRASMLYLSEKGRLKLPEIFPLVGELNDKLTANFTDKEIDIVTRFLNNVIREFK